MKTYYNFNTLTFEETASSDASIKFGFYDPKSEAQKKEQVGLINDQPIYGYVPILKGYPMVLTDGAYIFNSKSIKQILNQIQKWEFNYVTKQWTWVNYDLYLEEEEMFINKIDDRIEYIRFVDASQAGADFKILKSHQYYGVNDIGSKMFKHCSLIQVLGGPHNYTIAHKYGFAQDIQSNNWLDDHWKRLSGWTKIGPIMWKQNSNFEVDIVCSVNTLNFESAKWYHCDIKDWQPIQKTKVSAIIWHSQSKTRQMKYLNKVFDEFLLGIKNKYDAQCKRGFPWLQDYIDHIEKYAYNNTELKHLGPLNGTKTQTMYHSDTLKQLAKYDNFLQILDDDPKFKMKIFKLTK